MSDGVDPHDYIAQKSLVPLLSELGRLVACEGIEPYAEDQLLELVSQVYVAGHRNGQREATGQIAAEVSRHGIQIRLAPDLEEPHVGEDWDDWVHTLK